MEMVEVRTEALTGAALDWAVEAALGGVRVGHRVDFPDGYWCVGLYRPSTDWSQAGPLIDEHMLDFSFERDGLVHAVVCDEEGVQVAAGMYGATHLIAACRAIIAAKLGDTVQVPAELTR